MRPSLRRIPPAAALAAAPGRPFPASAWLRRRLVEPVLAQLTQGATPGRLAMSVAVGSLCAFFPILGAATPLCLLAGCAFRLNHPVIQLLNGATAPLYVPLVLGFVRLGGILAGAAGAGPDLRGLAALAGRDPGLLLQRLAPLAGHALLGWAAAAPLWIALVYGLCAPLFQAAARARPAARPPNSQSGR